MPRAAAILPGYASVARASEVLHLAKRSVRDLIYAGRLPSLRVGRLHFIKASDLDLERRRRLGLAPAQHERRGTRAGVHRVASTRTHTDPELRRRRAAERVELISRWAQRHGAAEPHVPAVVLGVTLPLSCEACGRDVRHGRIVELAPDQGQPVAHLCTTCGRRALLDWADRRRQEAAAARRLSESLGQPQASALETQVA